MRKSRKQDSIRTIKGLTVAVVEPEFPLNLGYVARCMANFGLEKLVIVSPNGLNSEFIDQASVFASHGKNVIKNMSAIRSFETLRKRNQILVGTTAIQAKRKSNLVRRTLDLDECATRVARGLNTRKSRSVCIVFGRDTTGLTNEEMRLCDYNVTIRTGSDYNTLNISHAAAIILYAFSRQLKETLTGAGSSNLRIAGRAERERAIKIFQELAVASEFQRFKSDLLRQSLGGLFGRSDPTLREIYLFMGLASRALSKIRRLETRQDLQQKPAYR